MKERKNWGESGSQSRESTKQAPNQLKEGTEEKVGYSQEGRENANLGLGAHGLTITVQKRGTKERVRNKKKKKKKNITPKDKTHEGWCCFSRKGKTREAACPKRKTKPKTGKISLLK